MGYGSRRTGAIEVNGMRAPGVDLWTDSTPQVIDFSIAATTGKLHVYNIWDSGAGRSSQAWSSGMLIEEIPGGRRYRCNDVGLKGEFDNVVFRLERIEA